MSTILITGGHTGIGLQAATTVASFTIAVSSWLAGISRRSTLQLRSFVRRTAPVCARLPLISHPPSPSALRQPRAKQ